MLKKSELVQSKVKRALKHQQSIIRKHISSKRTTDKRDKRKRRRV